MYTKEDLIARLQNGEDVDTIAQEMATALNAAQAAVEEEAKRAEQKVEEDRVWAAKKEAAYMMLDALSDYLIAVGEDELQKELSEEVEVEAIIKMLDSSIDMTKRLNKLKDLEFADEALWTPLFKSFGFGM